MREYTDAEIREMPVLLISHDPLTDPTGQYVEDHFVAWSLGPRGGLIPLGNHSVTRDGHYDLLFNREGVSAWIENSTGVRR